MTRIILVDSCGACPFQDEFYFCKKWGKTITPKSFNKNISFADWCPLEDVNSNESSGCDHEWVNVPALECEECGLLIKD